MRVVQCVRTDAFAGAERYVSNLAVGLAGRGCEVVVIGGEADRMTAALGPAGVRWVGAATTSAVVRRLVAERPFDIVHAHMTAAELAAVVAAPVTRAPIVATRHFAQQRGASLPARLVGRVITPRLAAQLAISHFVAERTEGPSTIVAPGTWPRSVPDPSTRRPVVLLAQRLEAEKRTELGLLAWQRSGLAAAGWRLWIAGGGQERHRLEDLADRLDIARSCDFLGDRDDVAELLVQASILLAPRPDEPYGLSVVEAMAAALPVVAAAGGGHLETVGQAPGAALYDPTDPGEAGRLLAALAADPARRARYGTDLRELHGRAFTVEAQVAATLDVYHDLLPAPLAARGSR